MNFLKYQDFISAPPTNQAIAPQSTNTNPQFAPDFRYSLDPRCLSINSELQTIYGSTNDELWIDSWLHQNNLTRAVLQKPQNKTAQVSLHQAKETLQHTLALLEKLEKFEGNLHSEIETMGNDEWLIKIKQIEEMKKDYVSLVTTLNNPKTISNLKKLIEKRKKKRLNLKHKKQRNRLTEKVKLEQRQRMHKEIDLWLNSMREEANRIKEEENIKRDADCVLGEVTKKKSDARKQLSLITSLVKLRSVRESMAIQRGEKILLEDKQAFNITTEKLIKMWEDSIKSYTKEEQGLRLMLEKTATEDNKQANLKKERELVNEWQHVLFGNNVKPTDNPTFWALTASERNMETFIAVRKSWDTFLVAESSSSGSKIPIGWVVPSKDFNPEWTKYKCIVNT
ncbi:unnamed protein product [Brassicogethes aeneus]|uniref:Programmed cell death protein 7 n=1 Tax=Brassicogethes aeneus TaxID=1431903 RepID=A0A9P0FG36_BRAAE|nr:unnamed protein product [Brassicogethes aeneus]